MSDILQQMDTDDALALVHLVGTACDPQQPLPLLERRRLLASGLAELVDADVWMSDAGYLHPCDSGDSTPVALCDGGWRSATERMEVLGRCMHSDLAQPIQAHVRSARERGEPATIHRSCAISDAEFYASPAGQAWNALGFDYFLFALFPLNRYGHSALGLHRRVGREPFTERDRLVVHVAWTQAEWLHRESLNLPIQGEVVKLSLRERQVLILLLGEKTRDEAAQALQLSPYTIGDFIKGIYRKLHVSSRAQLYAKFCPAPVVKDLLPEWEFAESQAPELTGQCG
jgi:DNA-binding CsgD family transcriptional regulator